MSAYDELVDRAAEAIWMAEPVRIGSRRHTKWIDESEDTHDHYRPLAAASLAEVLRTLETVTPEMTDADYFIESDEAIYLAMLRASPLSPP